MSAATPPTDLSGQIHHVRGSDGTRDASFLKSLCPLDNGQHRPHPHPTLTLGSLERLPLELLTHILNHTDLSTLTTFRRVSQRAMQAVDSLAAYQLIVRHALTALRGTFILGLGPRTTCVQLARVLRQRNCDCCGHFGGYVYLLACVRVCHACYTPRPEYYPLSRRQAKIQYGLSASATKALPCATMSVNRPAGLSAAERRGKEEKDKDILIDSQDAFWAGNHVESAMQNGNRKGEGDVSIAESQYVSCRIYRGRRRLQQVRDNIYLPRPFVWMTQNMDVYPAAYKQKMDGRRMPVEHPRRHAVVLPVPWVHPASAGMVAEWGFFCSGCNAAEPALAWRKYDGETFAEHVRRFGRVEGTCHRWPWRRSTDAKCDA